MGSYATQAELLTRFDSDEDVAYLTGDEATGTPSTAVLDDVLEAAEGQMNMRLAARYATPVVSTDTSVIAALKRMALDLAEAYLRLRKRPVSEDTQRQIDRVLETLDNLADGSNSLPGVAVLAGPTSKRTARLTGSGRTLADDSKRYFTRETASGM